MTTRAASTSRRGALLGAAALLLSGCAVLSPIQTNKAYIPGDGVPLSLPGLELRNLAVVAREEGGPGVVVGQVVNRGSAAVEVRFAVEGADPATRVVPASTGETLTDAEEALELDAVEAAPGQLVELRVTTREAGENVIRVPVLAAEGVYADLVP